MIERKKKICVQCNKSVYLFSKGRCKPCAQLVSVSLKKQKTSEVKISSREKSYDEIYLWPIFSLYTRFRDTDNNGIGRCFTCGAPKHYKDLDCGHGVGRQHKNTKYNEKNNHSQCGACNRFNEGKKDVYSKEVDKRYGEGTWDKLLAFSRTPIKRTHYEYDLMTHDYCSMVIEMAKQKGIDISTLKPVVRWIARGVKNEKK